MIEIPNGLVFLDVETTGLDGYRDRIIEIYALKLQSSGEVEEYASLLNPERALPREIIQITGLRDADLKDAPTEKEIAGDIREFIGNATPVAHNLPFDRRFLNSMFQRQNLLELGAQGIDTLALSREIFPRLAIYPGGGGSHRLSNLMYHFRLEDAYANSHRAKDDVMLLIEVFRHLQAYVLTDSEKIYPQALTHGCLSCGSAMHVKENCLICVKDNCNSKLILDS